MARQAHFSAKRDNTQPLMLSKTERTFHPLCGHGIILSTGGDVVDAYEITRAFWEDKDVKTEAGVFFKED